MTKPLVFVLLFTGLSSSLLAQSFELNPLELPQLQAETLVSASPVTASKEPSAVNIEPSAVNKESSAVSLEPSAVNKEPSAVSLEPSAVNKEPSAVSLEPSAVNKEPSAVRQEPIALSEQLKYDEKPAMFTQLLLFTFIAVLLALRCLRNKKRRVVLSQALANGQASHDQMQWLMAVLDNLPGMVLISDANGKPMLANKAYNTCVTTNIDKDNPSPYSFIGDNQSDECTIGGKYYRISRERVRHNDGHEYQVTVFADVTELKLRKQDLKISQQQAIDALKARESFLGIISHELRTPLAAMIGLMELLKPELKSTQNQELMQNAQASAERLKALVNDILDFSKMEAEQLQLDVYQGNLFDELGSMLRTLESGAKVKGIDFILDWQPTRLCHAELDWLRLSQIVNNILSNAIKFTEQGSIKVSVSNTEKNLYLSIEDSGCGMTQAQVLTLFQPFLQGDPSINRNFGGTGLGMSIVEHLVQLMDGEIKVESLLGQGTRVWVILPAQFKPLDLALIPEVKNENDKLLGWLSLWGVQSSSNGPSILAIDELNQNYNIYPDLLVRAVLWQKKSKQYTAHTTPKYSGKVLVADDDPINRFLFHKQLKKLGLDVVTVNDGQEALDYLTHHLGYIDLLISDCHMPNLNGYDLVRKLRAISEFSSLPIIGCTAEDSRLVAEKALSSGMDEIIYKPYSLQSLSAALGRYCRLQAPVADQDKLDWLNEYEIEQQLEFSAVVKDSLLADKAQLLERTMPLSALGHRIKGAANTLGLRQLSAAAENCETVTEHHTLAAIEQLNVELDAVINAINDWQTKQYQ